MSQLVAELADLLSTVQRPGDFYAPGTAELFPPALAVEGVGPIALPLLPAGTVQSLGDRDGSGMTSWAEAGWKSVDGVGAAAGRDRG